MKSFKLEDAGFEKLKREGYAYLEYRGKGYMVMTKEHFNYVMGRAHTQGQQYQKGY